MCNDLLGKGDLLGKQHLLELFKQGYPVIPSFNSPKEIEKFASFEKFLLKPLCGADSLGVKILNKEELTNENYQNFLIQPLIKFQYEVSFFFIERQFYYSLYAPDCQKRWELQPYKASKEEIAFALKFIDWNSCKFGIQRVDACKTEEGALLLMELEDYNPFLSLDSVDSNTKEGFLEGLCVSLERQIHKKSKH